MSYQLKFKPFLSFFVLTILFLSITDALSSPSAEEWIDVGVVVNVLDGADASNIDDAIAKANEVFAQAKIRLVKKATDPNATADTDSSGGLDRDERDDARKEGQKVLDKTVGAGKGIKIDISDANCDASDANTVGVAIHRNPVIIVGSESDANELGKTIAHELGHVFTLNYDLYDANDVNRLMYGYTGSGTGLDVNEVNEIRQGAKSRGTAYFVVPRILSGGAVAVPDGIHYSIDGFGAILDDFHDVQFNDPCGTITDQNDPTIQYADIGEVSVFADEPFGPNGFVKTTVQLGRLPDGTWNVDSFFDITYQIDFGGPLIGQAHIELQNWLPVSATWYDANGLPTTDTIVVRVNEESEFSGDPHRGEPHNKTLQVDIPVELIQLSLVSIEPIIVTCDSYHLDHRYSPDPNVIELWDVTVPFEFGLSRPCPGPSLSFALNNSPSASDPNGDIVVFGCGFEPNIDAAITFASEGHVLSDYTVPVTDGKLTLQVGCSESGVSSALNWIGVFVEQLKPPVPLQLDEVVHAEGFFKYCPEGSIPGDLDGDCDEDFVDFALFANNWLSGATTP